MKSIENKLLTFYFHVENPKKKYEFQNFVHFKVEKILEDILDSILSPSPSVKIQSMGRKVCLKRKGKTLLSIVYNF